MSQILLVPILLTAASAETVLVEAEGFDQRGGWVVDQQFMDIMGSPYLLAHGLGRPVEDAKTTVTFPKVGDYHLWVRTRDWAAPWNAPGAPGRFALLIDGNRAPEIFGAEGSNWHWQYGGTVRIGNPKTRLALHDLTGFDGRCDAIVFTDKKIEPPNRDPEMDLFRRQMLGLPLEAPSAGEFDLVVVGGGMAGSAAAVSAARMGSRVALIQDRPVLGGNNSSEIRVHLGGGIHKEPYPKLGDVVHELGPGKDEGNAAPARYFEDDKKLKVVESEENISLFLNTHANKVLMDGPRIKAVVAQNTHTGERLRFEAPNFADCTGDGTIGFLAGADYRMGREGRDQTGESLAPEKADKMTMGASVMWYAVETDEPVAFPKTPWAVQFNEDTCHYMTRGNWDWETGLNRDQIEEFERIRDYGLRVVYGNWSYLKNESKKKDDYAKRKLEWVAYIAGKRESRRLLGDVILKQQDIQGRKEFPDACVTSTWSIDLHYPTKDEDFKGEPYRTTADQRPIKPYPIPYRCLYSRNVDNLFMAGRDISVTHVALGTVRVMRTTGMMGEVVGMAAALCRKFDASPRGLYEEHLDALKQRLKEGVPE